MDKLATTQDAPTAEGSITEVFSAFLKLGLTSFGGPVAHLGYLREELVQRRKWLSESTYADLVALCQFLPGPASSQVGFSLGVLRGRGLSGGLAAWCGFTLPSALIMLAFALGAANFSGPLAEGSLHGLKLVAVAVVAQAVWGMARTLTPDLPRAAISWSAVALVVFVPSAFSQLLAIALGALAGLMVCRGAPAPQVGQLDFPVSPRSGLVALILFALLLLAPALLVHASLGGQGLALFDAFYRSGALVFGGGHVVLPLLRAEVVPPGWLSDQAFLAGYGVAQMVPGPLFTFAAYLGAAVSPSPSGVIGSVIALVAVFLPGLLLAYGTLPYWDRLRSMHRVQDGLRGANAAVVGILGAALYDPVWTSAVHSPRDFTVALLGFLMLTVAKLPPWIVVLTLALAGLCLALL